VIHPEARARIIVNVYTRFVWLSIALLILVSACSGGDEKSASQPTTLERGTAAPEFALESVGGSTISLASLTSSRNVLLYFSMGYG
jgi:hypothetical protein